MQAPAPDSITIYTDGSSLGNPGPGGYGATVVFLHADPSQDRVVELGGAEAHTTNNRMELMSVIKALEHLETQGSFAATPVIVHADSQYVLLGITSWIHSWKKNSWKTAAKQPVLNQDLWERLHAATGHFANLSWKKVLGHSGIAGNERVDAIATAFARDGRADLYMGDRAAYERAFGAL